MVVFITRIVVRANELKLNGESGKKKIAVERDKNIRHIWVEIFSIVI